MALAGAVAEGASAQAPPPALIAAAQSATLGEVDDARAQCGDKRRIADWLRSIVGPSATSIVWTAQQCQLVIEQNPMDRGTGAVCAQATITPRQGAEQATVEIFFEAGDGGRLKPFAFRATVHTKDGWDYMRDTHAFEVNWGEAYVPGFTAPQGHETCN